ncbi:MULTISPECIES: acetyl-CoA acetyltransferase [unclassified Amycolatopsis]|uniref:acetyl-CoA acetyltransferase n=1 Tax=unclassified Amycolatopsis TaxID=2618356 RepID=UPI002876F1C9|nr:MULTISPECIES: acetyl-CoA acetyltransferase [unclassified Amycolatopsis]MDS0135495.1 thiolase domain-containing protein [Amycolatopsis sp. 505]MDS0140814.1 thiolase domain-containing protein [Amycolatopsis sp. CM201R]
MTVFVLGGAQTDFARNFTKEGRGILELFAEVVPAALADAGVSAEDVEVAHVGNLAAELFTGQAQLGGLLVAAVPELDGVPSTRHEAACASGSTAVLAACADLEAGRYDVALVVGVELMRNVDGQRAAEHLGSAAWAAHEAVAAKFPWPALFADVAAAYDARYGLDPEHLGQFASHAFDRAALNPVAQARDWRFPAGAFGPDDELNPVIEGSLRKQDCGRITDGAAAVLLASPVFAERLGGGFPRIAGFGHRTAHIGLAPKIASDGEYLFPHLRGAVTDAYRRAGVPGPDALDVVELHDCFTITGLVALEHLGAAPPGDGGRFIADGGLDAAGINPGGGLIGLGHPVGATGVRMLRDAARQVSGTAGETQVEGARTALTLNVGGSFTTVVTMVVTA